VNNDEEVNLEVVNMLGQAVYSGKAIARSGLLDEQINGSSSLAAGVYMLNIRTANGSGTFRFVVEK
jgi:hypothetical protein